MSSNPNSLSERDLELLSAFLDGALDSRQREELDIRLAQDVQFRLALEEMQENLALLHNLPRFKAPRDFTLDAAAYGHPETFWKRLGSMGALFQLSGALGAAASIVLLTLALLSGGQEEGAEPSLKVAGEQSSTAVSYTGEAEASLSPAAVPTPTLAMVSPVPLALDVTSQVPETNNESPPPAPVTQFGDEGEQDGVFQSEAPLADAAIAPADAVGETTDSHPDTSAVPSYGEEQSGLAADADDVAAEEAGNVAPAEPFISQATRQADNAALSEAAAGSNPEAVDGAAPGAPREAPEEAQPEVLPPVMPTATARPSGTPMPSASPTSAWVTESEEQIEAETNEQIKRSTETPDSNNQTTLAIAGGLLMLISTTLFIVGRKRSHRT